MERWWEDTGSGIEKYSENPTSPFPLILFLHIICNVILPSKHRSSKESFCCRFPYKTPARDFLLPLTSKMSCPSHSFDLNAGKYTLRSKAHNYAVLSSILCLPLLSPRTVPSSAPSSRKSAVHVLPLRSKTKLHTHTQQQAKLYYCIFQFQCF